MKKFTTQAEIDKTIAEYIARGNRAEERREHAPHESAEYWKHHDNAVKWYTKAEALMPGGSHWAKKRAREGRRDTARKTTGPGRAALKLHHAEQAQEFVARGKKAEAGADPASAAIWYKKAGVAYAKAGVLHRARYWTHRANDLKVVRRLRPEAAIAYYLKPRPKRSKKTYRRDKKKSSLLRVGQEVYARFATRVMPSYDYIPKGTLGHIVEVLGRTAKNRRYRVRWRGHEGETGWYDAEALLTTPPER